MNKEEFKKFVIEEAKKHIFAPEKDVPAFIKENVKIEATSVEKKKLSITPDEVKSLAEEMKQLNKSIDFRNPLFSDESELISESENKKESLKPSEKIKRYDDMKDYNKGKGVHHLDESEKDKWQRILGYNVPGDTER